MNESLLIPVFIAAGVVGLVGALGFVFARTGSVAEQRLEGLSGGGQGRTRGGTGADAGGLLKTSAIDLNNPSFLSKVVPNAENLNRLYEQADVSLPFQGFLGLVGVVALAGGGLVLFTPYPLLAPIGMVLTGGTPFLWLIHRKRSRVKKFLEAMPEAVELIGRALRAGHGLASGMRLVAEEMKGPIADEFGRVFEEQNLGVPVETSLRGMADRIPSMDVRFFVIAVCIQRATGGDLAEVLDKIGRLIRQRFELFGHVRGLTAEGRLSGIVLMALPPGLLAFLSVSNYNYVAPLFKTPAGNKMLMATVVMQLFGAALIKKIVAIKV